MIERIENPFNKILLTQTKILNLQEDKTMVDSKNNNKVVNGIVKWLREYCSSMFDIEEMFENKKIPNEFLFEAGKQGLFGIRLSEMYGGLDLPMSETIKIIEQIAAIDINLATYLVVQHTFSYPILSHAKPQFRAFYLPQIATGKCLGCFALSEAEAGSNPRKINTTIAPTDRGRWKINGTKCWITGAATADMFLVFGRHEEGSGYKGISCFAIPKTTTGIKVQEPKNMLSINGVGLRSIIFKDVEIGEEYLIGELGKGMVAAESGLLYGRFFTAAISLGVMKRCSQFMFRYASKRNIGSGLLIESPVTVARLREIDLALTTIEATSAFIVEKIDCGQEIPEDLAIACKVSSSELAWETADKLVQLLGARGFDEKNFAARILNDTRFFRIGEGPTEPLLIKLGATLSLTNSRLMRYLRDDMKVIKVYEHLVDSIDKIKKFAKEVGIKKGARSISYYAIGKVGMWGFLEAGLAYQYKKKEDTNLEYAIEWVREKSIQIQCEVQGDINNVCKGIGKFDQYREYYIHSIGTIEESMTKNRKYLDDFLKDYGSCLKEKPNDCIGNTTIINLFEQNVLKNEEATAIICPNKIISYGELANEVNKLCYILKDNGVIPGSIVAIIMDRSPLLIVSLLATLKSGAAILMVNAQDPMERTRLILNKANANIAISTSGLREFLPETSISVLYIDSEVETENKVAKEFPNMATSFSIAYIAFTSGSTGVPKGVRVNHKAICSQILARCESTEINADDRILHSVAPNFDIAIWEMLSSFVYGCSVVLSNEQLFSWEPRKIIDLITKCEVTHMQVTPTQLGLLLNNLPDNIEYKLKCIFSGGEVLPHNIKEQFQKKLSDVELIHLYGPTEAVIDTCFCRPLSEKDYLMGDIGLPFSNKQVYILDESGNTVSDNTPGELYIGGEIAQDYLAESNLTKKSFLKDIFACNQECKMYRSGDIVKRLSSGRLQFLGRKDQQIKINGVRIESGEIETILGRYPNVKQLKVAIRKIKENDVLVAYYTLEKEGLIDERELREFATKYLPMAMVPSKYIRLNKFPLTTTGKIDVNSLPNVSIPNINENMVKAEKANSIFENIVKIWEELLECIISDESVDFFEMGGNSLMAIQLLTRIWEIHEVEINVIDFYENPTIIGICKIIAERKKDNAGDTATLHIKELLAGTQKNYWYMYKLDKESAAYNCPEAVRLKGNLNIEFLEWSINQIISRHEALRTFFGDDEGEPFQEVLPEIKYSLTVVVIPEDSDGGKEAELFRLLENEASRPFILNEAPLFAAKLFRLNNCEYVFFWNFHHIIADGWSSAQVFTRELNELYRAKCESRQPSLPEIEMQPVEYLQWQQKTYTSERIDTQREYWLKELTGASSEVDLTLEGGRALAKGDSNGHRVDFKIPNALYDLLKKYSAQKGISTYNVLVTAFSILAHILSGSDDICVGTVVAGRKNSKIEHAIGNFANVIVLRTILEQESTIDMILEQVRNKILKALDNSDISFEEVVSALKPNRDKNKNPLFNIFFSLFNGKENEIALSGLEAQAIPMDPAIARFDLSIAMFEVNQRLEGYVEYKECLSEEKTVRRIIKYFIKMLYSVISSSDQCVDTIELVDEEEKKLLCQTWNDCYTTFPRDVCMHEMFEKQVQRVPDKPVVCFAGKSLTYIELNAKANKLAHYLKKKNIHNGDFVGICTKPSIEMIVGILGIVKAGAAYVPIDPVLPKKRVEFILREIDSKVVVTQDEFSGLLLEQNEMICLDTEWNVLDKESDANLNLTMTSNQIIYMIFTSGSTGNPKAVSTMHYNVAALLCNTNHMQASENDRFLKINNFAFDISTWEIWSPLIYGATMIVMPDEIKLKPLEFAEFVDKNDISMAYLPTALFHAISVEVPTAFRKMKFLIVGGEALDPTRARAVLKSEPPKNFINALGPTEVTCSSAWYDVSHLPEDTLTVPIGRPISNTQFYVLNSKMKVLPIGATGELFIGGAGVSEGYHNRAELTKSKFISNSFKHDEKFPRLYQSGDLVKYQEDGNLLYMGRKDHQIKIRGFRIEIGEIENAIREHEAINAVAVLVKGKHIDDKRLAAYISFKQGYDNVSVDSIKSYLKHRLPYYMVPTIFKNLDALPYNKNGKIDRKGLEEIDISEINIRNDIKYPRNLEEIQLSRIWEKVVGFRAPSIQSNFFESGGDSLKAITLLSLIEEELSIDLPIEALFEHGTIEELASMLKRENQNNRNTTIISFRGNNKNANKPLYLVHPLSGSAICYSQLSNLIDNPVFGFQQLGNKELKNSGVRTIEVLASYYLKCLNTIHKEGPYLLGGWSMGGLISFEMARKLENNGQLVEKLILVDSAAPGKAQKELNMHAILKLCLEEAAAQYGVKIELDLENVSIADPNETYQMVLEQLKSNGVLSVATEIEELKELVNVCTNNIKMLNSYEGGKVNCDILLLHPHNSIQRNDSTENGEKYFGWENYTNGNVELVEVNGDHMSMIFEPNVKPLAKVIQKNLI